MATKPAQTNGETEPVGYTTQSPLDSPFADAASPFKRTEAPAPVFAGPPPHAPLQPAAQSTWQIYRSQINFGLAMLAYLMVLVGSITVVQQNPSERWRYLVAALPVLPAAFGLVIFVRALMRLDDVQVRIQVLALGIAEGATALITFGYAFFENVGLPRLQAAYVLPMMAIFWGVGTAFFTWRYMWRYRRPRR